ncbi:Two-component hybrid sensor and regulator [hydrothermal vent metagenome]|uniref:Two-component hybrid sensor and regulator n=1 Tax=hydrothermal vent metagenome TaxID=652676 RepID=A0A1W1EAG0_9ZZZZ
MKQLNILIVEDESIVAMELNIYLTSLGYHVSGMCADAESAFEILSQTPVDLVLMDICIKGNIDGVDAAAHIKQLQPLIQVIYLTAHLDNYNIDRAVETDPVAYLSKPFNRDELKVFLKIAQRRRSLHHGNPPETDHIILDDEFTYAPQHNTLYCCSEPIPLTKKEYALLVLFIRNRNILLDLYTIEEHIWPEKETSANTIRTLVKRLRQKLKHKFIQTIPSRGYMFTT